MKNPVIEQWAKLKLKDKGFSESLKGHYTESDYINTIKFGTAGLRDKMGAGKNRINSITIAAAAYAYGKFLLSVTKKPSVVIANDNRNNGFLFAKEASKVLRGLGIKVYVFKGSEVMATPVLSFMIRKLKATGGINITASHNPKEYNGFKVYNSEGAQYMPEDTDKISAIMDSNDLFNIPKGVHKPTYIDPKYMKDYIKGIQGVRVNNKKNLNIVYSPLHGTGYKVVPNFLDNNVNKYTTVDSEMIIDGDFSAVKSPNPEDAASYKNSLKLAKKTNSDLALVTDPDSDRVGVVARYKKRWKYITGNEIAVVYLDYLLNQMKGKIPKDAYIVKSMVSTDLAAAVAKKHGVRVIEVPVGFKNIASVIQNEKGTFIFGFEESYGFLIDPSIARDKDAIQGIAAVVDVASHLKSEGKDIFTRLKEIQQENSQYRNIQESIKIDSRRTKMIMDGMVKIKQIGKKKVKEVTDYRKLKSNKANMVKVAFKDGSWIIVRPSGTEPKVKIYIQAVHSKDVKFIDTIIWEKQVLEKISSFYEIFEEKKAAPKAIIKYSLLTILMVLIILFTFKVIYGTYTSSGSVIGSAIDLFNSNIKWIFTIWIVNWMVTNFVGAFIRYRLLKFHGERVRLKHLLISSIMGAIVSFITPLAIGGDAIGYWYLRRKGFKRGPLISTFLTSTIIWQIKNVILSAILVPMGIHMFKDIINSSSPEGKAVFSLFIIGLSWDLFATGMIWLLAANKRFQEWISRTAMTLVEWLPFTTTSDPGKTLRGYQLELLNLRDGFKKIWTNWKILLEVVTYEIGIKLICVSALVPILLGVIKPDLEFGDYWSQIISTDVIASANSFSLTPGSSGFQEFITLHINDHIMTGGKDTVASLDILFKFLVDWPTLLLSALMCFIIIMGENRKSTHNVRSAKTGITTQSKFYIKTSPIFISFFIGWILLFVLL